MLNSHCSVRWNGLSETVCRDSQVWFDPARLAHSGPRFCGATRGSRVLFQEQFSIWVRERPEVRSARSKVCRQTTPPRTSCRVFFSSARTLLGNRYAELPALAQQIIDAAPQYAISHAMCAGANALMTVFAYGETTPQERDRMRKLTYECADVASAIDARLGSPYVALATVHDPARGWSSAEALFQKSLAVEPQFMYAKNY